MNIQRGITHCDTIGDIFKNPLLIKFVSEWHQIKKEGSKIRLRVRENGEAKFTPEYYEFIREVFDDRTNMEGFLDYVREGIIISDTLYQQLKEYGPDNLVKALLSFDELNNQLAGVAGLTIAGVFKTRIADIIRDAYTQATHMEYDEDEDVIYDTPSLYSALEKTLEEGIMPINSSGEMIVKIGDGNTGHIVTGIGGNGEIYEVDMLGEPINIRKEAIARINLLEKAIKYHYSDDLEMPEDIRSFYDQKSKEFESGYLNSKNIPTGDLGRKRLGEYLTSIKKIWIESLKEMGIHDTTKIDNWEKEGKTVGVSTELPQENSGVIPKVNGPQLQIIK